MPDVSALRSVVSGPVLTRDDPGFADEVKPWMLTFEISPDVAVGATSAADVSEAVKFAAANGLAVRIQGTGHGSHQPITDGVLILTRRLDSLTIDPDARTARIGAGLEWGAVVAAAAEHGLAPITGSSGTVGTVGFLLGGGLGPLARSHGFGSDRVRDVELVLANGEIVHANANEHPELLWALRGGKGGLGVVTGVVIDLVELPTLYGGSLFFAEDDIEAVVRTWIAYTAQAHDHVTTSIAIVRFPDLPFLPEPLRGRTLLNLRFAYPGDTATGEQLAAPLRAAAPVYIDQLGEMPAAQIDRIHSDPPDPTIGWSKGCLLTGIDDDFATTLLGFAGAGKQFPFVATEVRHIGGATATDVPGGSAVGGRASDYTFNLVGAPNAALFETVIPAAAGALLTLIKPWVSPVTNVNFASNFASRTEFESAWPAEKFTRLAGVRAQYDPTGVFHYGVR
jgi:FAD/FMN-containing dehydrogenase